MTPLLKAFDLLDYVDGSISAPPEKSTVIDGDQSHKVVNP